MKDKAYFCPACGSPAVDTQELQATARCRSCDWSGPLQEAPVHYFTHQELDPSKAFAQEVAELMGKTMAMPLGKILLKWGFLPTPDPLLLATYLKAAAGAVVGAILQVRERSEKSSHG